MQASTSMRVVLCCLASMAASVAATPPGDAPPKARIEVVTDRYFGETVEDPYRWMEDLSAKETKDWIKAQADYAAKQLEALPHRGKLLKRLEEVSTASTRVSGIRKFGARWFYLRQAPDEQEPRLYVRDGLDGAERLLVDPSKVADDGQRYSIAGWNASHDGKYVSYQIAPGGSEQAELRVIEVASGKDQGVRIPRTNFGPGDWLPDGRSFVYPQFPETAASAPASEKYQKIRAYLHRLGEPHDKDRAVFGYGLDPSIPDGIDMIWTVEAEPQWNGQALAVMNTGVSPAKAWWIAPRAELDNEHPKWRPLVALSDDVSDVALHDGKLYALTSKGASRYRIVRTDLDKPDLAKAKEVFPETRAVIVRMAAQRDALYVNTLEAGTYALWRVDYESGKRTKVALPYPASVVFREQEAGGSGVNAILVSWTKPSANFMLDAKTGKLEPTGLVPPHPVPMDGIEFSNVEATSHDGTKIPMVIIHRKGLVRNGRNPTLMNGYGAYGIENISPFYHTEVLPWVEHGGVYVWTGIRGGGEYGEAWHLAGYKSTKPNTWKDFIACADYLVAQKYTSSEYLGIEGGSAGGILMSNAITERPDLFRAAIISVGMTNTLRAETTANGQPNIPEFGSVATEAGYRALRAMDGYHKVRDGVAYPAVLLTTGINDPRVDAWNSAKMAARLQAATSSGRPVLLRIDYDAGHGQGSTRAQRNALRADQYAFLLHHLGRAEKPPAAAD